MHCTMGAGSLPNRLTTAVSCPAGGKRAQLETETAGNGMRWARAAWGAGPGQTRLKKTALKNLHTGGREHEE